MPATGNVLHPREQVSVGRRSVLLIHTVRSVLHSHARQAALPNPHPGTPQPAYCRRSALPPWRVPSPSSTACPSPALERVQVGWFSK